ncbi:MAG: hypothetical protein IJY09_10600 [Lachnospiraceae bacterium]|nr:hypothetical protein [Lachnospiraceae bacterium]
MLKLMKYEFRKQLFSKLAIAGILILLEIYFFYGLLADNGDAMGTSAGLLGALTFVAILYVSFECIFTFNNDLKTKQSYMLFMTPQSTYSIMGAKILSAILQIILVALVFGAVVAADVFAIIAKNGNVKDFLELCQQFIQAVFELEVDAGTVVIVLAEILVEWMLLVILGMFSITLSTTFMANSKARGVVSFVIFIALNVVLSKVSNLFVDGLITEVKDLAMILVLYAVITVVTYIATAWMLEKKVSV